MFKQVKKARELQDYDYQNYNHDEFDIVHIIMTVIFSLALVGVWYYGMRADEKIESNIRGNNMIINDIQAGNQLNQVLEDYGDIPEKKEFENQLTY